MSAAHHRAKQPAVVRAKLLSTALDLLVDVGIQSVTLDAVAKGANVSKGGLLHHFPSRAALIDAISDQLLDDFERRFAAALEDEPEEPGRYTRAYIRVSMEDHNVRSARALALLSMFWPGCISRCETIQEKLASEDGPKQEIADAQLLLRLTVEGFWYAQARGSPLVDEGRRRALQDKLESLHQLVLAPNKTGTAVNLHSELSEEGPISAQEEMNTLQQSLVDTRRQAPPDENK